MAIINVNGISGINSITAQSTSLNFYDSAGRTLSITAGSLNVGTGASISSPATNVLTLGTNNVETVRIDSSGNLGIGTNNPAQRLHIQDGSNNIRITGTAVEQNTTSGLTLNGSNASGFIAFRTAGDERARIDSNGNLGIGTNNPVDRLHMHNGSVSSDIVVTTLPASQAGIRFGRIGATYQGRITYDNPNDALLLYSNGSERLRIDSSGNLGIGTTVPRTKLDVAGGGYFTGFSNPTSSGRAGLEIGYDGSQGIVQCYDRPNNVFKNIQYQATQHIFSGGNIKVDSGYGMDFSAAGNAGGMSSELLDDYEEGTWTPTLTNFSSGSPSYQYQEGHYTKIGRYVIAQGIMGITNSNTLGSGTIQINLPFTSGSTTYGQCGPVADGSGFTSFNQFGTMVGNSASVGQFVTIGTSATGISYNQPSAAWYVRFCFMYHTVT